MSKLLETMADEFCCWPLPESVNADDCATYRYTSSAKYHSRTGTNLLTHAEALAMFTEIVGPKIAELEARLHEVRELYTGMDGFIPETAPEAYQQYILGRIYKAATGKENEK